MIWERGTGPCALAALLVCVPALGGSPARAQAPATQAGQTPAGQTQATPMTAPPPVQSIEQQYAALIRNALAEMNAQNYLEARALFLKAHELQPSARTERGLGSVEFELKHYTWAAVHFRAALTSGVRPLDANMRKEVEQALARAQSYTGYLHLTLSPGNGTLAIDGQPATLADDGTVWLDIGDHELRYEAPGHQAQRQTVAIVGGERAELAVTLQPTVVPGPRNAVARTSEPASPGLLSRWWFWTAAGVVVAGAVIGVAVASSGDETQPSIDGNLDKTQSVLRVAP